MADFGLFMLSIGLGAYEADYWYAYSFDIGRCPVSHRKVVKERKKRFERLNL